MRRPAQGRLRTIARSTAIVAGLLLGLLIALPAHAASATLYVDGSNPSCSDSGPGTQTTPLCTIGAGATRVIAGQTVQVAAGTYSEAVTLGHSGTSSAPIVITSAPGASVTITAGTFGIKTSGKSWITIQGFIVSQVSGNGIYVTSASSNITVSNVTVSGTSSNGIRVDSSSNVMVSGATVSTTNENGIYVVNSSNVTVQNSHTSYAGHPVNGYTKKGIYLSNTSNSLVQGNTSDHNTDAGIFLANGSTNDMVSGNVTFANARQYTRAAPGIDVRSSGNTVSSNVSYNNEDSGIQFYNGGGSSLVYDNVCYSNGDHGIDNLNSPGQVIVSNTVYGNVTSGINVEGTAGTPASSGATLENNISVDNGLHSFGTRGNIRVDANSTSGTSIDYDLVYLSSSGTMFTWGNTQYSSLTALRAATGQESNGLQGNPLWVSAASANFQLQEGSPAIDSANSGAPGQPSTDVLGNPRADDPLTANTGAGPRSYDDRGAYEYQPA